MAEEGAVAQAGRGGSKLAELLTKKTGPFPNWVYLVGLAGLYWYYEKRNASSTSTSGTSTATNQQTDPAGNVGTIDPSTGYVDGTPEDEAALAADDSGTGTGTDTGTTGSSTTAGVYADNSAWAEAAINYLVGIGIDPTAANSAIEAFLASQTLTTEQQADVNTAIQRIGAPPSPPAPGTAASPIVSPPSAGTVYATNPPTGFVVASKAANTVGLKWNKATNAAGYTVHYGLTSAADTWSTTTAGTQTSVTVGNLKPATLYYFKLVATPAKAGAGSASVSASTTKAAAAAPVKK